MTSELKPCPFCGGEATRDHWVQKYMECKSCGTYGPDCIWPDSAENAWNTRAAPAPAVDPRSDPRVVALVEALRGIISRAEFAKTYQDDKFNFGWMIQKARAALDQLKEQE